VFGIYYVLEFLWLTMNAVLTQLYMKSGQNGFGVDSYDDPFLALDNFKARLYDLVILGINMPKMNGFSFYRQI
jgi:DNA-binding response OmpR family regulator